MNGKYEGEWNNGNRNGVGVYLLLSIVKKFNIRDQRV